MCGIIGFASNKSVTSNIINSLKRLEYRGYDSAGIATISKENLNEKKCSGRVEELEKILFKNGILVWKGPGVSGYENYLRITLFLVNTIILILAQSYQWK